MDSRACPPDQTLRSFLFGETTRSQSDSVEQHLLTCDACLDRAVNLQTLGRRSIDQIGSRESQLKVTESEVLRRVQLKRERAKSQETSSVGAGDTNTPNFDGGDFVIAELKRMLTPPSDAEELGRLDQFRILKLLGYGGMGVVLMAEDLQLRRRVALKLLKPGYAQHPQASARFLREARSAASVRHVNVVTIYQVGVANGIPFIAQELLEGETLDDRLSRDRVIKTGTAIRICKEIASGLHAAHSLGLMHRDIKPANIWLEGEKARAKILDFGLARSQEGQERLTQSGAMVGTPAFMSPEQSRGEEVSSRSDLFSLGVVMYRMTTGRLPFHGNTMISVLHSLTKDTPPSAKTVNPRMPQALSDLIDELLQKEPNRRPASAAVVIDRLKDIVVLAGKQTTSIRTASSPSRKLSVSNRKNVIWGMTGLLLIICTVGFMLMRFDRTKPAEQNTASRPVNFPVEDFASQPRHEPTLAAVETQEFGKLPNAESVNTISKGLSKDQALMPPSAPRVKVELNFIRRLGSFSLATIVSITASRDLSTVCVSGDPVAFANGSVGTFLVRMSDGRTSMIPNSRGGSFLLPNQEALILTRVWHRPELPHKYSTDFAVVDTNSHDVIWEARDAHLSLPSVADLSSDCRYFITAGYDGTTKMWDLVSQRLAWKLEKSSFHAAFDRGESNRLLVTPSWGLSEFPDAASPLSVGVPISFSGQPACFLDSRRKLALVGGGSTNERIHVLNLPEFDQKIILEPHGERFTTMSLLADGKHVFTSCVTGDVNVFSIEDSKRVFTQRLEFEPPGSLKAKIGLLARLAPDGETVFVAPNPAATDLGQKLWVEIWKLKVVSEPH